MTLLDSHVVVLGGTSGIGLAVAQMVADEGARVTVASSRTTSVDKALAALPVTAAGHAVDLGDTHAVRDLFAGLGAVDHLVYTAGEPLALMPVATVDLDRARAFFELRYFAALNAVRSVLPVLQDGGSITLTTGTAGQRPDPGWSVASSICGAVEALTRSLAVELAPRIRVNAVAPGVVRSPLWETLDDAARDKLYASRATRVPLQRVGEVDDAARAYRYCMTQNYATGTLVTVDGGAVLA